MAPLYIALVHYPVLNRMGETIASAITNLDLHDLARSCCTYGVPVCYIVTPLKDQQALAHRLTSHWINGKGGEILPERREALKLAGPRVRIFTAKLRVLNAAGGIAAARYLHRPWPRPCPGATVMFDGRDDSTCPPACLIAASRGLVNRAVDIHLDGAGVAF